MAQAAVQVTPCEPRPLGRTRRESNLGLGRTVQFEEADCLEQTGLKVFRLGIENRVELLLGANEVAATQPLDTASQSLRRAVGRDCRGSAPLDFGFARAAEFFQVLGSLQVNQPRG